MCESMIERVAKAIDGCLDNPSSRLTKGMTDGEVRAVITDQLARAAIEAMREPTRVMCSAAYDAGVPDVDMDKCYRAMIDAVLAEDLSK